MSEDIINRRAIQWFPGHMAKTLRLMETEIRNVDCVLQILDAVSYTHSPSPRD